MSIIQIKKGKNIRIKGQAEKKLVDLSLPKFIGVQPPDFRGLKPKVAVKVENFVKVGTPILTDKNIEGLNVVSPASGKVVAVNRGAKRALIDIVIETDGKQEKESFPKASVDEAKKLTQKQIVERLLAGGVWPAIRQRPFSNIANPSDKPKSIFVHAMNTEPLAADVDFLLADKENEFRTGLELLAKLTEGKVHVCLDKNAKSQALTRACGDIRFHKFSGPHPAGNVSTHIYHIDPIQKGDVVWYIEAVDVVNIAKLILEGEYPSEKIVAVTGEKVAKRFYAKTIAGAQVASLLEGSSLEDTRVISGSVLKGRDVGEKGFVGYYDNQISAVPAGGKRKLLGWMVPGFKKYSLSRTFLSSLNKGDDFSLDTDKNGSDRAIVLNDVYDKYVPLDIPVFFLLRSIYAGFG